jgi:hypothetical protein
MILSRKLHLRKGPSGPEIEIQLRIESLEKHPNKPGFLCVWSLDYLAQRAIGYGEDELSALQNALEVIRTFLVKTEEDGITVWWRKPGDYGGIPAFEKGGDELNPRNSLP